ncbi:bacteriocin [Reichenbachiella agariperforans]|nr:bacteriocin [Reichenbachiella agariperforans]
MKNQIELGDTFLRELTHEELKEITGGDKFMYDVGYAIGSAAGWLWGQTASMRATGGMGAFW